MFKVNNKDTVVFIVNFEQVSQIVLVFPLLTLNKQMPARNIFSKLEHFLYFKHFNCSNLGKN